jgi:zinc metalloprotease ZmpB
VTIGGYYAPQAPDLVWERVGGWQPMIPPITPFAAPLGAAGSGTDIAVVGPFAWTPDTSPQSCLLMTVSAPGDPSNIDTASSFPCAIGPTPLDQLARFDNNIAVRSV